MIPQKVDIAIGGTARQIAERLIAKARAIGGPVVILLSKDEQPVSIIADPSSDVAELAESITARTNIE